MFLNSVPEEEFSKVVGTLKRIHREGAPPLLYKKKIVKFILTTEFDSAFLGGFWTLFVIV